MTEAREAIAESVVAECSYIQPTLRNEAQAHLRAMMRLAIQEYEAALSEAGWVVAPMYTNSAQRDAGVDAVGLGAGMSWANRTPQRVASDIYRAMISAATPPAKGGEDG